jgi:predicted hydrocarbon binding protein
MSEDRARSYACFPNRISRILLLATGDVLGPNGSSAVLTTARLSHLIGNYPPADFESGLSFVEVGRLFEAIEGIYGVTAGQRLLRQAGRESFKYWMEGFGGAIGVADVALRVLPHALRARIGIEVLAEIFNRYSGQQVILGEGSDSYFFTLEVCGFCAGRHTDAPACSFPIGILEESLFWVSRGRRFVIEETTCMACGDPVCTLFIDKVPLDHAS